MTRVVLAHPDDFWANNEMAYVLNETSPLEAIGYYRVALVIPPEAAPVHYNLGNLYLRQNRLVEAIEHFGRAIRLEPMDPWARNNLGRALDRQGKRDESLAFYREAVRVDPADVAAHCNLGRALLDQGRIDDAIAEWKEVIRLDVNSGEEREKLQGEMLSLGRGSDVRLAWQAGLATNPPGHDAWFGYAELCLFLGEEEEYRRSRRELLSRFGATTDPQVAERTGRACVLSPGSPEELQQAARLIDRALAAPRPDLEWAYPYFQFAKGLAEYRLGRFESAISIMSGEAAAVMGPSPRLVVAMARHRRDETDQATRTLAEAVHSYDWSAEKADSRDPWIAHILRREAEALILPNLSAFLEGTYQPSDIDERMALLGVCRFKDRRAAMAELYAAAFAANPSLAGDLRAEHRYNAACAAAVAGSGGGADGARLSEQDRARWRKQALAWLRADLEALARKLEDNPSAQRIETQKTLAGWRTDPDLAGLRDPDALDKLPPTERQECRALWRDADDLLARSKGLKE